MRILKSISKVWLTIYGFIVIFYLTCFHYTDQYQCGITYNVFTGELKKDSHQGYHVTPPWVLATRIDTRPHKVCIVSATRNMNCRLVRFNPDKYMELISYEGFSYYWWYNRISFNSGQETYRGVDNLLLGHAYGETRCSCVEILQEVGNEN
jgi:hypothetical protein